MPAIHCPECGSSKLWKDGIRKTNYSDVQRWLCRDCGFRFSFPPLKENSRQEINTSFKQRFHCQVGASLSPRRVKNLVRVEPLREGLAGATKDTRGKIVEFMWKLKREGLSNGTIRTYSKSLLMLEKNSANLQDSDSVTDILALQENWKDTTKSILASAYQKFAELNGIYWKKPRLKPKQKLPFIPLESEIDSLIASHGKKIATILQTLKETGMRIGEAERLKWTDVNFEQDTITLNETEKNGKPRMFKVSSKLIAMLNNLPRKHERIFASRNIRRSFWKHRKRVAAKLQNPRLLRISFHTLRHWKATMEYHRTKDILHVKEMLGHRSINNTLIYTQIVTFENKDEFHSATARTVEEAKKLIEAGFEYICDIDSCKLFRKRK